MKTNYQESLNSLLVRVVDHELAACEAGAAEHSQLFGRLKKTWVFYRYLVDRGTANESPMAVRILYAKISNCLVSIFHSLQQGYPGPAVMVLRSLFEAHVHMGIILEKDTLERSKLFEDFIHIEREYTYSMVGATEESREQHQQALAAVRGNYHPDKPHSWCWKIVPSKRKDKRGVPRNPSFRDLCEHIGQLQYYEMIYGRFSAAIHTVPSYESWIRREEAGPMELGPQFSSRTEGKLTVALAIASFVAVLQCLKPHDANELVMYALRDTTDYSPSLG